ncbi:oligoendopeptidase F, partial [bacterium]
MPPEATSALPSWDLSFLYTSPDDPKIEAAWSDAHAKADALGAVRGRIESGEISADELAGVMRDLETLYVESSKPIIYASLRYSADASDPAHGAFYQAQSERSTALS